MPKRASFDAYQLSLDAAFRNHPKMAETWEKKADACSAAARYMQTELDVYEHFKDKCGNAPSSVKTWMDDSTQVDTDLGSIAAYNFEHRESDESNASAGIFVKNGWNPPTDMTVALVDAVLTVQGALQWLRASPVSWNVGVLQRQEDLLRKNPLILREMQRNLPREAGP